MSGSALHGGGLSAVLIEPCFGTPGPRSKSVTFRVYGDDGADGLREFGGAVDGPAIYIRKAAPSAAERTRAEGLKFYCRLAPVAKVGNLPELVDLENLADLLKPSGANRGPARPDSDIPAAYTYLGQFIAHEISNLRMLEPDMDTKVASAALDLDSLFGAAPDHPLPEQAQLWKGGVGIGQARSFGQQVFYDDLPRRCDGKALIADARNDSNLALAQLHLALSKFHQVVAQDAGLRSDEDARRVTRRHVQSVVLHDYLRRVIEPGVYCDVIQNGRRVIHPGGLPTDGPFLIPIEFAAACFRVGHSMVRDLYANWGPDNRDAFLQLVLSTTGDGTISGSKLLSEEWIVNWNSMIEANPGMPAAVNMAFRIDGSLAGNMHVLPERFFSSSLPKGPPSGPTSIALATLARHWQLEINSGQNLIDVVNAAMDPAYHILTLDPGEVVAALVDAAADPLVLEAFLKDKGLDRQTPLWLYCLSESRKRCDGRFFGPLTSRIVMETIHAAIEAAPGSIVEADGKTINFVQGESLSGRDRFLLPDLIAAASVWPNPR